MPSTPLRFLLPALTLLALSLLPAQAQVQNQALAQAEVKPVTSGIAEMRLADIRLEKPVKLAREDIFLTDLLENLSKQSDITVKLDQADQKVAYLRVAAFVGKAPVGDVMDRLWSLFSYQKAEWLWKAEPQEDGTLCYVLSRSAAARRFPQRLREDMLVSLERDMDEALASLKLPKEELVKRGKKNKLIEGMALNERDYDKIASSNAALSQEGIRKLMRGGSPVNFNIADLPPEVMKYASNENKVNPPRSPSQIFSSRDDGKGGKTVVDSVPVPKRAPATPSLIQFHYDNGGVVPRVFLMIGTKQEKVILPRPLNAGIGVSSMSELPESIRWQGGVISGGVGQENAFLDMARDRWIDKGDTPESPLAAKPVLPPGKNAPTYGDSETGWIAGELKRLSQRTGFIVLARLPTEQKNVGTAEGRKVGEYLTALRDDHAVKMRYKWRQNTILLTYPRWFLDELDAQNSPIPPEVTARIDKARQNDPAHLLPLVEVCFIVRQVEAGVLLSLPAEVAEWGELLAHLDRVPELLPRMQSEEGMSLATFPSEARAQLRQFVREQGQVFRPETDRLRMRTEDVTRPGTLGATNLARLLHIDVQRGPATLCTATLLMDWRELPQSKDQTNNP